MKARVVSSVFIPVLMAAALCAQPAQRPDPAQRQTQMLTRFLTLDADQQTQVQSILTAAHSAGSGIETTLKTLRTNLIGAAKSNDVAGINVITQQMSGPKQQLDALRATTAAQIYALLRPDQKTKVDASLEMLMGGGGPRGGGGFGGGHHGGPPPTK